MAKAIIVVDMPEDCADCKLHFRDQHGYVYCQPLQEQMGNCDGRDYECPLESIRWEAYDRQFDISFVAFKGEVK